MQASASMTKLVAAVAAMQCVERGQMALDDIVGNILPELADPDIIEGFDEHGEPRLSKAKTKITLRYLVPWHLRHYFAKIYVSKECCCAYCSILSSNHD